MIFTAELNKLAWQIKKSQNISWGAAFRMAVIVIQVPSVDRDTNVFGTWTSRSHKAVAGHFWGLHKAYSEIGDTGRSIAMESVKFRSLIRQKGIKESIAAEILDFYKSSYMGQPTKRSLELMQNGATHYQSVIKLPTWTF